MSPAQQLEQRRTRRLGVAGMVKGMTSKGHFVIFKKDFRIFFERYKSKSMNKEKIKGRKKYRG